MGKNTYGKSIVDGRARFTSASSLTTFDPNSYGGCNRKWYIEKVLKVKQEETEAMRRGTNLLHKPIETYYETGIEKFPPLAMSVRKFMYERGPDLLIEQEIGVRAGQPAPTEVQPMTDAQLAVAPVKAGPIPVVGRMDLTHGRGYYIDENGELRKEPNPYTVEVNDWKSTSAEEFMKTGAQLRETVQMLTYGKFVIEDDHSVQWYRGSHTYALTKGAARGFKRTTLMPADEVARRWEYIDGLGREMSDAAAAANSDHVPANRKACNAYGKGCPFKYPQSNGDPPLCSAGRFNSLTSLFGEAGAAHLLAQSNDPQPELIPAMSILSRVNGGTPPTITPVNTPAAVGVALTIGAQPSTPAAGPSGLSMLEALEAEDTAAQPYIAPPQLTPDLAIALSVISTADMGHPKLAGEAFALYAAYGATCSPPRTYAAEGAGRLSGLHPHTTAAELLKLADDLKAHAAKKAAQQAAVAHAALVAPPAAAPVVPAPVAPAPAPAISILSPETPASNPALASLPVEGFTAATINTPAATVTQTTAAPTLAPVTEVKTPITEGPVGGIVAEPAPKATKPKAERKKAERKPQHEGTYEPEPEAFELYINCIPSKPYENLDGHVAQWCSTLVGFFQDKEKDLPDIRCITSDNRMNFGKWPGPLAALVREVMVEGKLPRGVYVLDTRDYSIAAEVANAMISARREDGTAVLDFYVKGIG